MAECFECGAPANEKHHPVPRSLGGRNTIWLCYECHGKVHGHKRKPILNLSHLIIQGMRRAKAAGKNIGRKQKYDRAIVDLILSLKGKSIAVTEIGRRLDIPASSVRDIIKRELCRENTSANPGA